MLRALPLMLAALLLAACAGDPPEEEPTGDPSAEVLYDRARGALDRGDYQLAVARLEQLESRYPFGVHAQQAQLDIIYAYQQMGEPASAVAAAERFIRLNPRHPRVDYAWYMQGVAQQEQGRGFLDRVLGLERAARDPEPLRQAFEAFRTLLERHPQTEYARDARRRMADIRDLLARHELRIARFYADRGAWVAAANRAAHLVREYEGAPAMGPALQLLERSYAELGASDLRREVRRVLEYNDLDPADA
ncbi:outer membrane protein assembly factor BamD [Arhodomonas sp. SL1]|uniref:outer membrane protein assembly factor BamD n=1 Tax=Arhodomonas sp. SL1 TaxID=3425691 RepID=UPI003F880FAA